MSGRRASRLSRVVSWACPALAASVLACVAASAQEAPPADVEERFRRLERIVAEQAEQIRRLSEQNRALADQARAGAADVPPPAAPFAISDEDEEVDSSPSSVEPDSPSVLAPFSNSAGRTEREAFSALWDAGDESIPEEDLAGKARSFLIGAYDKGFALVAPSDRQRTPFSLKLNVTTQVRYTGFARSVDSWTNSAGMVLPTRDRSYFSLNRNWFSFSGFAFSPRLRFNATVFSTSATNQTIALGFLSYEFSKALIVNSGYFKVPGTREWIESARYPLGVDRTLANTFFRPGISPGVWVQGEPIRDVYYVAGIFNDLSSVTNVTNRANTNMTYVGNFWWEPLGSFGPGFADEEFHETPVVRLGASVVYDRSVREPNLEQGLTNPENTILRLSDGTPLYLPNALAPGATVERAHVLLASYDLAVKYRGLSLSSEIYTRWMTSLRADVPTPAGTLRDIDDVGGFAQGSFALVPRRFELFARTSGVFGRFSDGGAYGGGFNWEVLASRNIRATFEAKRVNHSPADNVLYGYFVGQSGTLFQLQVLTDF